MPTKSPFLFWGLLVPGPFIKRGQSGRELEVPLPGFGRLFPFPEAGWGWRRPPGSPAGSSRLAAVTRRVSRDLRQPFPPPPARRGETGEVGHPGRPRKQTLPGPRLPLSGGASGLGERCGWSGGARGRAASARASALCHPVPLPARDASPAARWPSRHPLGGALPFALVTVTFSGKG